MLFNYSIYVTNTPPLANNTRPDDKLEFVLFFSNEYFGIKIDLNGKKKNHPGVSSLGFELTFLSEFKRVVWRVLDRTAKRCACISQAPAKEPFEVF